MLPDRRAASPGNGRERQVSGRQSDGATGAFGAAAPSGTTARRASTPDLDTVVTTAAKLFHRYGYQNTTMQAIADELGIAKPTLYVHAKSKSFLLGQIFQRVLNQADLVVEEAMAMSDPTDGILHLIRGQIKASMAYREYYGVIYGDQRELPEDLERAYRSWSKSFVTRVRALVERGQEAGVLRREITPVVAAQAIIGITGWSARWLRPRMTVSVEAATRQISTLILEGLAVPGASSSRSET